MPMYLQYELTARVDFVQPTENIRKSGISPEITENQKKLSMNGIKIYLEDILRSFSSEEVEQIIEKRLRRKCMTDLCRKYYVDG